MNKKSVVFRLERYVQVSGGWMARDKSLLAKGLKVDNEGSIKTALDSPNFLLLGIKSKIGNLSRLLICRSGPLGREGDLIGNLIMRGYISVQDMAEQIKRPISEVQKMYDTAVLHGVISEQGKLLYRPADSGKAFDNKSNEEKKISIPFKELDGSLSDVTNKIDPRIDFSGDFPVRVVGFSITPSKFEIIEKYPSKEPIGSPSRRLVPSKKDSEKVFNSGELEEDVPTTDDIPMECSEPGCCAIVSHSVHEFGFICAYHCVRHGIEAKSKYPNLELREII